MPVARQQVSRSVSIILVFGERLAQKGSSTILVGLLPLLIRRVRPFMMVVGELRGCTMNMKGWLKRIVFSAGILLATLAAVGLLVQAASSALAPRRYPAPGELVDVGGHRLHLYCLAQGSPTVIPETGLDYSSNVTVWGFVQPRLAEITCTCAYDRAGFGWSEDGPLPRDSRTIVRELKTLLSNARIAPPYVLVAHSLGGLHMRLYASTYPEDVAGMVLIDASYEEQVHRLPPEIIESGEEEMALYNLCRFVAPMGLVRLLDVFDNSALPGHLQPAAGVLTNQSRLCRSVLAEYAGTETLEEQLTGAESLGDLPLVVLSAGKKPDPDDLLAQEVYTVWQELQKEHVARSSNSMQMIAAESGHYIQLEQPELVVEAVRTLLL